MTRKIYKSAQGKTVDMGALQLQNESVRAVGNMNVNARGDVLDSNNRVIDQKNRQVVRQYQKQSNTSAQPVTTSTRAAKQAQQEMQEEARRQAAAEEAAIKAELQALEDEAFDGEEQGGLAAAIARARTVKQDLEKTAKQIAKEQSGVKKL